MLYDQRDDSWGPVTHFRHRQEPYVQITFPDGTTTDGKALAWTRGKVYAVWVIDEDQHRQLQWMDANHVRRIDRDQSSWRDPYDDMGHYYPAAPADGWV
ncbi:MAG: hypothetical protein QJR09_07440 [Micrococcus sp.]|nr:hypothetical protein [Micrococcus sp.]